MTTRDALITTFHGSFQPSTFDATRAWFCVEVEDEDGVHSCGGTFTSLKSPNDAENWIKAEARERGFVEVIWDTRDQSSDPEQSDQALLFSAPSYAARS